VVLVQAFHLLIPVLVDGPGESWPWTSVVMVIGVVPLTGQVVDSNKQTGQWAVLGPMGALLATLPAVAQGADLGHTE
jgi:hypothetical protein